MTSHAAARDFIDRGRRDRHAEAARRLVHKYPGYTFRHLFERHVADCRRANVPQVFEDPPALMRRLSEPGIAYRDGVKRCRISGKKVSRWWPVERRR